MKGEYCPLSVLFTKIMLSYYSNLICMLVTSQWNPISSFRLQFCYQLGVFLSRSSVNIIQIDKIEILAALQVSWISLSQLFWIASSMKGKSGKYINTISLHIFKCSMPPWWFGFLCRNFCGYNFKHILNWSTPPLP